MNLSAESIAPFKNAPRLTISACGTAFYAGLIGKYWFEKFARLPVEADVASELRYRHPVYPEGGLCLYVSQSGETADTLAAMRDAKAAGQRTAAIVNVQESSIAREADIVWPTYAGPEIGVASTKAFTCQLSVLASLAIAAARARGHIDEAEERRLCGLLLETPRHMVSLLTQEAKIEAIGHEIAKAQDVLYLGRGVNFPLALEGALKLKEISYIHAEGYAAGEMKHGPIALIDRNVPVIVIAPSDELFEKTISNMHEVMARGGKVVLISGSQGPGRGRRPDLGIDRSPRGGSLHHAADLRASRPIARLSHRGRQRHRCGPAAQSREIRDRGVALARPRQGRKITAKS